METEELWRIPLLAGASPMLLERLASGNQLFSKRYAKGTTVHNQRERCVTLDVVLSGSLAAYSLAENGSAANLFEFRENGMIGANLMFGENGAYPLNIYAVTDCALLHMTKDAVMELLHGYDFVMKYIQALSSNSQGMNRRIAMLAQKTLRENLMDFLRAQAVAQGTAVLRLPMSKKELADYLGVQRPSLFREMKKLKEEGVIAVDNRSVRIIK